jgi:hypothetical protein
MTETICRAFLPLCCELSPENLCCDGEASPAFVKRKLKDIRNRWAQLEKKFGVQVTEDEVWDYSINNKI